MSDIEMPFFSNIDPDVPITKLQSLCMACHEQGETMLMCTQIPYFREVILTSFSCDACGYRNTGYQSGTIQKRGLISTLQICKDKDVSRSLALSEYATIKIPEADFEIPPNSQQAAITTVEGIIRRVIDNLSLNQDERKESDPDLAEKIESFIKKMESLILVESTFKIIVDDPSGNSCIEEPNFPSKDSQVEKNFYIRSAKQNEELGFTNNVSETIEEEKEDLESQPNEEGEINGSQNQLDLNNEVQVFETICDQCQKPSQTKMKLTAIPFFSDVVIMATDCSHCGHRSNEVKSGGGIKEKGQKITLCITNVAIDMSRDLLKSDNCSLLIPELDLKVGSGVLVSKFTTVEGLLRDVMDDLKKNPFLIGDAIEQEKHVKLNNLLENINKVINGVLSVSLILDDPTGNSYLQNPNAPDIDPFLTIEEYDRTFDQNEDLGLNDMKTENYTDDS